MRNRAVAMLPTWRTEHQAQILHLLLTHPEQEYTLSDVATTTGVSRTTVQLEVGRLLDASLLTERRLGRLRLVRANPSHPATAALTTLVNLTFGAKTAITEHFSDIGAERIILFGSWAARDAGEPGPPPKDVDVLVLTTPEHRRDVRARAYVAARAAEVPIGLPVNVHVLDTPAWDDLTDPLIANIHAAPYETIVDGRD